MQMIFIHGSGASARVWKYQTRHFAGSIAINMPGHPDGDLIESIPEMAAWIKAFADEQGWSELVLVGHSMGGGVALQYALDYPEDVRALVLVGSGGRLRVHPDTLNYLAQADNNLGPYSDMLDGFWENTPDDFAAELKADGMALGAAVFLSDARACDQFDIMDRLETIAAPTLAIVGTDDIMTPAKYAHFLAERMPNAEVKIIEGGTHSVFAEYPNEVNTAIESFLAKLDEAH